MIFQHTAPLIFDHDNPKSQTRRIVKPGDVEVLSMTPELEPYLISGEDRLMARFPVDLLPKTIISYVERNGRMLWCVGGTYAVQPGRTQKGIGHIQITAIRKEQLQDISEEDAHAELGDLGFWVDRFQGPEFNAYWDQFIALPATAMFKWLWKSINPSSGERWADNPAVWVLHFEPKEVDE